MIPSRLCDSIVVPVLFLKKCRVFPGYLFLPSALQERYTCSTFRNISGYFFEKVPFIFAVSAGYSKAVRPKSQTNFRTHRCGRFTLLDMTCLFPACLEVFFVFSQNLDDHFPETHGLDINSVAVSCGEDSRPRQCPQGQRRFAEIH